METKVAEILDSLKEHGISKIDLIAIVTDTSYEVVFYGFVQEERLQSNKMAEKGYISSIIIDDFYELMAKTIRTAPKFDEQKLNVLICAKNGDIKFEHYERDSSAYKIKKEWKTNL